VVVNLELKVKWPWDILENHANLLLDSPGKYSEPRSGVGTLFGNAIVSALTDTFTGLRWYM
jgi:hypothetical protein